VKLVTIGIFEELVLLRSLMKKLFRHQLLKFLLILKKLLEVAISAQLRVFDHLI